MTIPFGSSASLAGLLEDRPSPDPTQIGRFYLATNIGDGIVYRDNGSAWEQCSGRPCHVYRALLSQSGSNAPAATILESTMPGAISFSYAFSGFYIASITGTFPPDKTFLQPDAILTDPGNMLVKYIKIERTNNTQISIQTFDSSMFNADDVLINFPFQILLYT
jgi:hypothetical protein